MQQTNFYYLQHEFPILYNLATSAEYYLHSDPVISLMKLRQFGKPQAILAKAFRGELVVQNPNDEPAKELLERIQAEREGKVDSNKSAQKFEQVVTTSVQKNGKAQEKKIFNGEQMKLDI